MEKKLYENNPVKYLRIQTDRNLTWKQQINHVTIRLNKGNATLSKLRNDLDSKTLRSVGYAIFASHSHNTFLIWI